LGAYSVLIFFKKIGRKTKLDTRVFDKLIKSSKPIEEVPSCVDKYNVLKEKIVVKPLNKIAKGVFDSKIKSISPKSSNLLIR
tara:strand:+ start:361 stop:606 length:246 start_codon:yes stop_codon:yes gene_type:complete